MESFGGAPDPCLFLQLGEFLEYLCLELGPEVVSLLEVDLPLLPAQPVVLEPCGLLILLLAASFAEVVLDLLLNPVAEGEILDEQILINRNLPQYLLHLRLIEEVYLRALGGDVVDLIYLFLEFGQFGLVFEDEHDLEAVLLGRGEEDEAAQVADVLRVVGEVGVQLEVEVDVQVLRAHDAEAMGVLLLVEDQQPRTVLLPVCAIYVDQHLHAVHKEHHPPVLVQSTLQLLLQQGVDLHLIITQTHPTPHQNQHIIPPQYILPQQRNPCILLSFHRQFNCSPRQPTPPQLYERQDTSGRKSSWAWREEWLEEVIISQANMGLQCAKPADTCLGRSTQHRHSNFHAEMRKIKEITAFHIKINHLRLLAPCPSFRSISFQLPGTSLLLAPFGDFRPQEHFLASTRSYSARLEAPLYSLSEQHLLVSLLGPNGNSYEVLKLEVGHLLKGPVKHDHLVQQLGTRLLFELQVDQLLRTRVTLCCEANLPEGASAGLSYSLSLILSNSSSPEQASKVFEKHEKIKEVALGQVAVLSSELKDAVVRVKVMEEASQESLFELLLPYSQLQLQNGFKSTAIEGVAFQERMFRIEKGISLGDTTGTLRLQLRFLQSRLYAEQMECVTLSEEGIVMHTISEAKARSAAEGSGKDLSVQQLSEYSSDLREMRRKGMSEYDLYLFLEKMFLSLQERHFPISDQLFAAQDCLLELLSLLADCLSSEQQMLNEYLWGLINGLAREPVLRLKYFCSLRSPEHRSAFAKKFYRFLLLALRRTIELTANGISFKELVSIHRFIAYAYFRLPWCQEELLSTLRRSSDQPLSEEKLAEIGASHALRSPSKSYFYDWEASVLSLAKREGEFGTAFAEVREARRKNPKWATLLFDRDYEQLFYSIYSQLWDEGQQFLGNNGRTLWEYFPRYGQLLSVFLGEMTSSRLLEVSVEMRRCNMKLMRNQKLLSTFMMLIFPKTHLFETYCVIKCLNLLECYFAALAPRRLPHNFHYDYFLAALKSILSSQHSYLLQKMLAILFRFYSLFSPEFREALNHYILSRVVYKLFLHWSQDVRNTFHLLIIFRICQNEHQENPELQPKRQKDAIQTKLRYEHVIEELYSRCREKPQPAARPMGDVGCQLLERMKAKLAKRKEKTRERESALDNSEEISEAYVRKGSHFEGSLFACKRKWSVVEWEPEEVLPSEEELKYLQTALAEFQSAKQEPHPLEKVEARSRMFQADDDQ